MKRGIFILFFAVILSGCGGVENIGVSDNNQQDAAPVTTDSRTPEKKFVEDELDSLIRSTSSLVDLSWKTSVAESIDNYQFGLLSAESTISDLELAKQQYNNKIEELDNFNVPNDLSFNDSVSSFISGTLESLAKAIEGRIEVIDYLIESVNAGAINDKTAQEIETRLIVPNANLQLAAKNYGLVFENVD